MNITIGERYKITSDSMNVILQELKFPKATEANPNPEPKWVNTTAAYHGTLEQACMALLERVGRDSGAEDVATLIAELHVIRREIVMALNIREKVTA